MLGGADCRAQKAPALCLEEPKHTQLAGAVEEAQGQHLRKVSGVWETGPQTFHLTGQILC